MADLLEFPPPLAGDWVASQHSRSPAVPVEPRDAEARRQALDITSSWIVEAPAGSGKTGLLLQRLLKLLAYAPLGQPEEVLAITFTRKATAELRERLLKELTAADQGAYLPANIDPFRHETRELAQAVLRRDREAGWKLLERPDRLNIRTIDSVCGEIARTLPLLSGSGGAGEPIEDATELYQTAASRTLGQLGTGSPELSGALRVLLLHRDAHLGNCTALIARMLRTREQWGKLIPLTPGELDEKWLEQEILPRLERALQEAVCAALSQTLQQLPEDLLEELTGIASRSARAPGHRGPSPIACCSGLNRPPADRADDLEHWIALAGLLITKGGEWRKRFGKQDLGFCPDPEEVERLQALIAAHLHNTQLQSALHAVRAIPPARYPREQWFVIKALFRVLRHAMAELKLLFAERGQCDFSEMALAAREVLTEEDGPADLAEATGIRFRHVLVDEMQDTSTSQYDLLTQLTRAWGGEGETLFLVGDPKQSIYLFRQANVERFLRTFREGRLGPLPVAPLRLTANFRSQSGLVRSFNETFSAIFPAANSPGEASDVPFVAAVATRKATPRAGLHWHAHVYASQSSATEARTATLEHRLREARAIRQTIEQWQARPLPRDRKDPWRIAVLARYREHLVPVIAELNRRENGRAIPYRAVNIDPLASRPEVLDLLALTRALLHPADRIAWLAVLHAPWCGLGRADLLALTGEGTSADRQTTVPSLVASRGPLLSTNGQLLLARSWDVLSEALATLGRTPFSTHLERTWRSLGGDASLTPDALTNAENFFRVLRQVERQGSGQVDLHTLHRHLERLYAEPNAAGNAVELLTIHKSKGLEWDVVLIPGLERHPSRSSADLLNWLELDSGDPAAAGAVLAPVFGKGEKPDPLNQWIAGVRKQREIAESKRLLYVASTRAREELHLFGACARKQDGTVSSPPEGSLLRAGWSAAAPYFEAVSRGQELDREQRSTGSPPGEPAVLPLPLFPCPEASFPEGLSLAASADPAAKATLPAAPHSPEPPRLTRLPLTFHPQARFFRTPEERLPYTPASLSEGKPLFERPEGSFTARAFGNVVHRFLNQLPTLLAQNLPLATLRAEVAQWTPRVTGSLRGEGIAPALAEREAPRVLYALLNALDDTVGRWLLAPHRESADEYALTSADSLVGGLRVDRTFLAGAVPLLPGENTIWIVDFKTAEPGGREVTQFLEDEKAKYRAQLETYASVRRALPGGDRPIRLALYYPSIPSLIHWESEPKP